MTTCTGSGAESALAESATAPFLIFAPVIALFLICWTFPLRL
jgi:hypothetical protein